MIFPTQSLYDIADLFNMENGVPSESLAAVADSVEFKETDGKKFVHVQYDEDTEYWAVKSDNRIVFSAKTEEGYSYYSMGSDGMVTVSSEQDFYSASSLRMGKDGKPSILDASVISTEDGVKQQVDTHSVLDVLNHETDFTLRKDNQVVGKTTVKIDENGKISSSGYTENGAFEYKSRFLGKLIENGKRNEGHLLDSKIDEGIVLDGENIWALNGDKFSLVGVLSDDKAQSQSIKISGKKFSYMPADILDKKDVEERVHAFFENQKEIFVKLGVTNSGTLTYTQNPQALKKDLKIQSNATFAGLRAGVSLNKEKEADEPQVSSQKTSYDNSLALTAVRKDREI